LLLSIDQIRTLMRAAPQLRALTVDAQCRCTAEASSMLRNESPFEPLRVHQLALDGYNVDAPVEAVVLSVVADAAAHVSLAALCLGSVPLNTPAVLDAVVDAALARRLSAVRLFDCSLSPASAPALARLIGSGLARLDIENIQPQLDVPSALLLGTALRASTTLNSLRLGRASLWHDHAAAVLLISALFSHPTLRVLDLSYNHVVEMAPRGVAAATLGALVALNAPALHSLDISGSYLGNAGVEPLVDALAHNTHLRTLRCPGNFISEAFARTVLLPAVQANASLRELELVSLDEDDYDQHEHPAILLELQDMVAARAAAAVHAPP
jgi:Ran GTPase-activating protein (RanGAP) involved in mRNA processing and transport